MLPVFGPNTSYNHTKMCTFLWTFCHQIRYFGGTASSILWNLDIPPQKYYIHLSKAGWWCTPRHLFLILQCNGDHMIYCYLEICGSLWKSTNCSHVYLVTLSWQWCLRTSAECSKFAHVQGINQLPNIFHFQEVIGQLAKLDHKPVNFRNKKD